ncbi:hypothetical protein DSM112329_01446 [Paraconexibacter sp. AEG42_29]|uniref:Phage holin family protein n=1 Tax=Paraconexibacter sp. AEG42_29 TaxID=2997339 RepID=A0AAU7ASL3_9ACTN
MADNRFTKPGGGDEQPPPAAIAQAIADISEKTSVLIREEIELAKAEVVEKMKSLVVGIAAGVAASVFIIVGLYFSLHGLALLSWYEWFPDGQYFWGYFVVAGVLILLGVIAGYLAAKFVKKAQNPAPTMAIREAQLIKETLTASSPEKKD